MIGNRRVRYGRAIQKILIIKLRVPRTTPIAMGAGAKTGGQLIFEVESINKVLDQLPLALEKKYTSNMEKAKISE